MTEIPDTSASEPRRPARRRPRPRGGGRAATRRPRPQPAATAPQSEAASRIPAHLLERAKKAARAGAVAARPGGGTATATAPVAAAAVHHRGGHRRPAGRRRPGRAHPAPAHRRQVRLDPGRQGHAAGQGPRLAAPAGGRVRGRAALHRLPADLLDLRERPAAHAGQHQPDAEPVEGAVVLPRPAGAAHDVPPDGRRRDHPGHGHLRPDPGARTPTATRATSPRTASSPSR